MQALTDRQIIVTSCEPAYFGTDTVQLLQVREGKIIGTKKDV